MNEFSDEDKHSLDLMIKFLHLFQKDLEKILNRYSIIVDIDKNFEEKVHDELLEILDKIDHYRNELKKDFQIIIEEYKPEDDERLEMNMKTTKRIKKRLTKLKSHGLYGSHLQLKLDLVGDIRKQNQYAEQIHDQIRNELSNETVEKTKDIGRLDIISAPFRKVERKIKINLLEASCTVLGSLESIFPGLGIVNEFKDVVKNRLKL